MLKIGITGGIGSGKTTACKIFSHLGIPVYYADIAAKILMEQDEKLILNLRRTFGDSIYDECDLLNKKLFGEIIFNDPEAMKTANSFIHPAVRNDFEKWMHKNSAAPYVMEEAAILFESGADKNLDYVILVSAPEELRFKRVMLRDQITEDYVKKISGTQMSEEEKKQKADFSIVNDDSQLITPQVLHLHSHFLSLAKNKK